MKSCFTGKPRSALAATILITLLLLSSASLPALAGSSRQTPPAPQLRPASRYLVAIPKSGFGKDYLFSASVIPQEQAATSTALEGKIVRFELFPDGVDMYESPRGIVVTRDLPVRRLLATFPILRRNSKQVVIDFNKGMRQVFTQTWTSGGGLDLSQRDTVLAVPDSRVFAVRRENGRLVVRQSVEVRNRQADQNLVARYEVRYFISPYAPGRFKGKQPDTTDNRYVRFFETEGQIARKTGRVSARIVRFDLRHPIRFYYSANTPSNYVQSVKDGILYWNLAFGTNLIQVKEAPKGATAPNARYNIIQWVPWDNAGFAYADVLMDPLDGETEHGQAYITSVFAFAGRARARALLRALLQFGKPSSGANREAAALGFGVPFLDSAPACRTDPRVFARQMAQGIQEVLASGKLTDAAVLRISQDYVRETVAHEVGHILGLRHNFAASLATTLTRRQLDQWFKAYVAGKPLDAYTNKIATSSMMDYNIFKAAVFTGWRMRTVKAPLPYDQAAIAWGYFNNPEVRKKKMLFATDGDVGHYGDVRRFDYGRDPVVGDYAQTAEIIDLLPNDIIETFIRALAPRNPHDRIPLKDVNLSCKRYAGELVGQFGDMLSWFNANTRSLLVEHQFNYIGELNQKARYRAHWKFLNAQIKKLGGVDRALFSFLPVNWKLDLKQAPTNEPVVMRLNATNLTAKLKKLLNSPTYKTFVGLDNKTHHFTTGQRALILRRGGKFFKQLDTEVVKETCQRLINAPRTIGVKATGSVGENDIVAQLERRIIDLAKQVITAQAKGKRLTGKLDKGYVQVVHFQYDQATRTAAAKDLGAKCGSFKGWAADARTDLHKALKKHVDSELNLEHFKDFKISLLSRPIRNWYQQQQDILKLLPAEKSGK